MRLSCSSRKCSDITATLSCPLCQRILCQARHAFVSGTVSDADSLDTKNHAGCRPACGFSDRRDVDRDLSSIAVETIGRNLPIGFVVDDDPAAVFLEGQI